MDKITEATNLALQFGMIDGAHHKQWVIDQMLRILNGEKYDEIIKEHNLDEDYEKWDEGIAP